MTLGVALALLIIQGVIGAFDTLNYHEYKAKLVARISETKDELVTHAIRDFLYTILFVGLALVV